MRSLIVILLATAGWLSGQGAPPIALPPPVPEPKPQTPQQQPPAGQQQTTPAAPRLTSSQGFLLGGVSLVEMVDIIAKMLKINYILDSRVQGKVTIYTYGEVKPVDLMPLLETILRVNNAAIVKVGELYRIVPINAISNLPLDPVMNADPKTLPDDERMILNLIFLKYATASEMDKLLAPFYGEGAQHSVYEPANLLILQDNSRNMKRTMDLIGMFDADTFAGQRVRLFDVENSRPSDLVKELESVFKSYALSEKSMSVKFVPVDRINTMIVVAPNPGIFTQVAEWIKKLDIAVKVTQGGVNNYVYRLKYGRAETLAMAIMALYSGNPMALAALGAMAGGMGIGGGMNGGMYGGGYGGMGYGGMGYGGMGNGGMGYGGMGYGGMGYGGMGYGGMGYAGLAYANMGYGGGYGASPGVNVMPQSMSTGATPASPGTGTTSLTGNFLGAAPLTAPFGTRIPHVIPNPFDNTLLIQGTPQEWDQISGLLRQLDVPPRQVLIDAKIYELDLNGAFSSGVQAFLQKQGSGPFSKDLKSSFAGILSTATLRWNTAELQLILSAAETKHQSRVIASPSIIATDSIPATMSVGQDVPVLTSQALAGGVQQGGNSLFTNTISSRSTGTTLSILARVNSSGIVTMQLDQQVSEAQGNSTSGIDSPSFSKRSFSTQVTVQDGETIAIGGFIQETKTNDSAGVPVLHKIPIIGAAFGGQQSSKARTELIIFLTPRVIYDTNQIQDATDEIKGQLKKLQKSMRDQQ